MEDISMVEVPDQLVLGMRKRGAYAEMATMFPGLYGYALEKGASIAGPPVFVCHETCKDEVKEADKNKNADLELVFPVGGPVEESETYKCYTLAGGTMAKIVHKGPYEECEAVYDRLFEWIFQQGKAVTGPVREVYLNDPRTVKPEEILTEIYAPIG